MDVRHSIHYNNFKEMDTDEIRQNFLIESLFINDEIKLTYSHEDRMIVGGARPLDKKLSLIAGKEIGAEYFLERREIGIINIGGEGALILDGEVTELSNQDGIYIGMGVKDIEFHSKNPSSPAEFYIISLPAHTSYPTVKINIKEAQPLELGETESLNKRTIYQYVHPNVCQSCQLLMGLTKLDDSSVWNTMPCHTHDRRMEAYLYFDFKQIDTRVFHLMGLATESRHIIVSDRQAIISPPWSIHSGVGTGKYTFIWAMGGENQTFTDMDMVSMETLR